MLKVLAGELSATFNLDGGHYERYVSRKEAVTRALCEQLLLHDQVIIPTHDYLTVAGLVSVFGERTVIELLDSDRLRFLRLQGLFGYLRGNTRQGGLVAFEDPAKRTPQDCDIERSIRLGLNTIDSILQSRFELERLVLQQSANLETKTLIKQIQPAAYADLMESSLWRDLYKLGPNKIALPKVQKMQVRMLGPGTDTSSNVVDVLNALALTNIELALATKHGCASVATGSPLGDCIDFKRKQQMTDHKARKHLWTLFELERIPNFGVVAGDSKRVSELLSLTRSKNAENFRHWFHSISELSAREIEQAYIDVLRHIPWTQTLPARIARFATTSVIDVFSPIPVVGTIASALDAFAGDLGLTMRSPKMFVDDLQDFSGRLIRRSK